MRAAVIPLTRTTALRRALDTVRFDQYYLAEQKGWVLYLEDRTDLAVLKAFADLLGRPAAKALRSPFVVPVGNQSDKGREHFNALVEAKPDLQGYLLVDRDAPELQMRDNLVEKRWERREIENYLCQPETLESFAWSVGESLSSGPLFEQAGTEKAVEHMRNAVADRVIPAALRDRDDPWWSTVKATDEFLDLVFPDFYRRLGQRPDFRKADYYRLVTHIPRELISPEVVGVLWAIHEVAGRAKPAGGEA